MVPVGVVIVGETPRALALGKKPQSVEAVKIAAYRGIASHALLEDFKSHRNGTFSIGNPVHVEKFVAQDSQRSSAQKRPVEQKVSMLVIMAAVAVGSESLCFAYHHMESQMGTGDTLYTP